MVLFLALLVIAFSTYIIGSGFLIYRYFHQELNTPEPSHPKWPKAAIIAPCKDLDPDFEANMRMLLQQDYPNYEVYFATVDEHDSTYPVLSQLVQESSVPAHLYLGGFTKQRCQKLDNIIKILEQMGTDIEVFAWVDSDSRVTSNWLRNLVAPLLKNDRVGASTGFRWYLPEKGRWLTYCLCMWTGYQFSNFYNKQVVATWGGSMAIRRDRFEQFKIREKWEYALSDDCVLNECVKEAGYQVKFVSRCMTSSSSDYPSLTILIFAIRQAIIAKLTLPKTWAASVLGLTGVHIAMGYGIYSLVQSLMATAFVPWTAWAMLSFIPASMIQALMLVQTIRLLKEYRPGDRIHGEYAWALFAPLAYTFLWITLSLAVFSNRFEWREIYYRMVTRYKTDVYKYPERFATEPPTTEGV